VNGSVAARRYPVLDEVPLTPMPRRRFARPRRRADEIPDQPLGTRLVFQVGGAYVEVNGPLRLGSPAVVDASAVAVVSVRLESVDASVQITSWDASSSVVISARFHCRVVDAEALLDGGCVDVVPLLQGYLLSDQKVRMIATNQDVTADPLDLQKIIVARLIASYEYGGIPVPGMSVKLGEINVEIRKTSGAIGG
jgi:hypothetical protein